MIVENYDSAPLTFEEGETPFGFPKVFISRKPTRFSSVASYCVLFTAEIVALPASVNRIERFDAVSGESLDSSDDLVGEQFFTCYAIFNERNGATWLLANFAGENWAEYVASDDGKTWTPTGRNIVADDFTPNLTFPVGIDTPANRLISASAAYPAGTITIYDYAAKTEIQTLDVGSSVRHILLEDESHCFLICDFGIVVLLDYVHGRVLSSFRLTYNADQIDAVEKRYAWDPFSKRILVTTNNWEATAAARGYYPLPSAVALTQPIPLQVARKGRKIRVATRAYGDAGEAIAGRRVTLTEDGPGALRSPKAMTDARGYAFHTLSCDDDGMQDLSAEAES